MKKCNHCQRTVADDMYVCDVCGGTDFEPVAEQPSFNPYNYVPYQGEIKAKMKPGQIALIVLGCAAIILTAVLAIGGIFNMTGYTEGELVDGVYYNEWAEFKLEIPENWPNQSESEYADYEDSRNDCGLCIGNVEDARNLVVLFENISGAGVGDEDEYLQIVIDDMKMDIDFMVELNISIDDITDIKIADKDFRTVRIESKDYYVQYLCVRKQDNRMIAVSVLANNDKEALDILSRFEHYSED